MATMTTLRRAAGLGASELAKPRDGQLSTRIEPLSAIANPTQAA